MGSIAGGVIVTVSAGFEVGLKDEGVVSALIVTAAGVVGLARTKGLWYVIADLLINTGFSGV